MRKALACVVGVCVGGDGERKKFRRRRYEEEAQWEGNVIPMTWAPDLHSFLLRLESRQYINHSFNPWNAFLLYRLLHSFQTYQYVTTLGLLSWVVGVSVFGIQLQHHVVGGWVLE